MHAIMQSHPRTHHACTHKRTHAQTHASTHTHGAATPDENTVATQTRAQQQQGRDGHKQRETWNEIRKDRTTLFCVYQWSGAAREHVYFGLKANELAPFYPQQQVLVVAPTRSACETAHAHDDDADDRDASTDQPPPPPFSSSTSTSSVMLPLGRHCCKVLMCVCVCVFECASSWSKN